MESKNPDLSQAELLKQIYAAEKEQAKFSRIRMILTICGLILFALALILLFFTVRGMQIQVIDTVETLKATAANMDEVAREVKKIDFSTLEESFGQLADTGNELMKEIRPSVENLDELMESAEKAMSAATDAIEKINKVDFEKLNEGIQHLNEILVPLSNFLKMFNRN